MEDHNAIDKALQLQVTILLLSLEDTIKDN
jgi:hypothetical protein